MTRGYQIDYNSDYFYTAEPNICLWKRMVGGVCGRRGVGWNRKLYCGLLNIPYCSTFQLLWQKVGDEKE